MADDEGRYYYLLLLMKKRAILRGEKRRKFRRYWVHPLNRERHALGIYHTLLKEMRLHSDRHTRYLRMNPESFNFILGQISPLIQGQDTNMRKCLEPGLKLAVTLHHLAEGMSQRCIADHYRLGRSTVCGIIQQTCDALWQVIQPVYLKPPTGPHARKEIADG